MALLLGANIKEATWLNSNIANAEAERIQIESAHQQATYELQERLAAAQTEAEIQDIQREQKMLDAQYEHNIQVLNQDVINRQRWTDTKINLVTFLGNVAIIALASGLLFIAIAAAIAILQATPKVKPAASHTVPEMQIVKPLPERVPYDPWTSPIYRRKKIKAARLNERKEIAAHIKAYKDPANMSKEEYKNSPLAGD